MNKLKEKTGHNEPYKLAGHHGPVGQYSPVDLEVGGLNFGDGKSKKQKTYKLIYVRESAHIQVVASLECLGHIQLYKY